MKRKGPVTRSIPSVEVLGSTDGRGLFRFSDAKKVQRFTFDGTAGGLRSDHVYAIFQDREGVIWFGTDRGVCRYDPNAARVEAVGNSPESNFVRTLYQTTSGHLLAGTNRGLFVYNKSLSVWNPVAALARTSFTVWPRTTMADCWWAPQWFFVGQKTSSDAQIESQSFH